VDEIEWQIKEFKVKELCIYDDNFSYDLERAHRICDLILDRGIKINFQFPNGIHIGRLDRELLEKLKSIGTHYIGIAPETGNKVTMQRIKKQFEEEKVKSIVSACKELKLKTLGFFMLGFSWEGSSEVKSTIEFAKRINTDLVQFTRLIPYKQTGLYNLMPDAKVLPSIKGSIDRNPFFGGNPDLQKSVRMAYRDFYFRIGKILSLLVNFSPRDLFSLIKYAISTRNI
jgi:radical SAM superfamily enzyme YgiQ (UPF0313 family)